VANVDGTLIETTLAELNPRLDDGYVHYFRAECTEVAVGPVSEVDMIEGMTELARMNHLQKPKVWVEELHSGRMVGRLRANIDTGQSIYFLDVRRYLGETSIFDAWPAPSSFRPKVSLCSSNRWLIAEACSTNSGGSGVRTRTQRAARFAAKN
jgi:hypothetical protein